MWCRGSHCSHRQSIARLSARCSKNQKLNADHSFNPPRQVPPMRRIPSLDGVRAIAVTLVLLGHLVKWKHIAVPIIGSYGSLGVQIFFVLSGFLITKLLLREYETRSTISLRLFYIRRAFRIFPAALAFLGVASILFWQQLGVGHLLAALFYVANMDNSRPWFFGHLWSLGIEEQFYLLWPLALTKWFGQRTKLLLVFLLVTPVFRTLLYAWKVRNGLAGSLPVFGDQLAIGCLLAVFQQRMPTIRKPWAAAMLLLAALSVWFPANTPPRTLFMLFFITPVVDICIAALILHAVQMPYWALNCRPVAWLGRISYSLYLWQELFCSNPYFHAGLLLMVPAVICAGLSYYGVEQPLLKLRDRWFRSADQNRPNEPIPVELTLVPPPQQSAELTVSSVQIT